MQRKYGVSNVTRIIAFGKMTPKSVARKVMNTFGHPVYLQNEISKLIPEGCKDLFDAVAAVPRLQELAKQYATEFHVMERLQNVTSHLSQHAGGVLIYPGIGEVLPVSYDRENEIHVAGFDKYMLEDLGHFKFDVLGLETLPVLHGALQSIRQSGTPISLTDIPLDSKEVYDMLCDGDVSGVFQIAAQSGKVMQQKPRNFKDLIAINALIRPGVGDWEEYLLRRNGKEYDVYEPRKAYMNETVGTMTYQEQFLLDCHVLAGWEIAYADKKVRKNKNIREDTELRAKFLADCVARGHEEEQALAVWREIEDAVDGGYSFNKSHSASYAMLTYQTAYLKCHFPQHFYAALMSGCKTDGEGQDEISGYIAEAKKRGIQILPPDINNSSDQFVVTEDGINYRITTVKHVGDSVVPHLYSLRPIVSFADFLSRRNKSIAKKNVVINLIKAGAFDFDNPNRAHLLWEFDMHNRKVTQVKQGFQCETYPWDDETKLEWEREVLGMYLSSHPMERYGFQSLDTFPEGGRALQGGEIYDLKIFQDRNKRDMAFIFINTLFGNVKCLAFAGTWKSKELQAMCDIGNIILVNGKRSGTDVLIDKIELLGEAAWK